MSRLVAVLGYSDDGAGELHPVCAARLAHAETVTRHGDTVLLTGRSRRLRGPHEAELMARAWRGPQTTVVLDRRARTTYGNALAVARTARHVGAREVVLVTSGWHARRAASLVGAAVRRDGVTVALSSTRERGTQRARLRELACWPLVPLLALAAGRR